MAAAPSGASVGKHEALSFPEGGIDRALEVLEVVESRLRGFDASDPGELTRELKKLDPTPNLSRIGASVAFAVTVAAARAYAALSGRALYQYLSPEGEHLLPMPVGNIVGGGKHALSPRMDLQELLVIPVGATSMAQAVRAMVAVHRRMGAELAKRDPGFTGGRGDEGAWASTLSDSELLGLLQRTVEMVESELGVKIRLGVDVASSALWDERERVYRYRRGGLRRDEEEQFGFITRLIEEFDLYYIEDPFHEDSFDYFSRLTSSSGGRLVCGDDLVATNLERLRRALAGRACNAVILKVNQVGYLSEALIFAEEAVSSGATLVSSHRSGETPDDALAHIAIASRSKLIKTGVVGGERVAKLNELIRIEEQGLRLARDDLP
jgi:enolase